MKSNFFACFYLPAASNTYGPQKVVPEEILDMQMARRGPSMEHNWASRQSNWSSECGDQYFGVESDLEGIKTASVIRISKKMPDPWVTHEFLLSKQNGRSHISFMRLPRNGVSLPFLSPLGRWVIEFLGTSKPRCLVRRRSLGSFFWWLFWHAVWKRFQGSGRNPKPSRGRLGANLAELGGIWGSNLGPSWL